MAIRKQRKHSSDLRTKSIRLKLTSQQIIVLETLSNEHRFLYNHLLAFAKTSWFSGKGADFKGIIEEYKKFHKENNLTISSKSAQNTALKLIENIKSFYNLRKKDKTSKFPKNFVSYKNFKTFIIDGNCGVGEFRLKDSIITLYKRKFDLISIKLPSMFCDKLTRKDIISLSFKRDFYNNYFLDIVYSTNLNSLLLDNENYLSIDLGISNIVTCYSNKINNFQIHNSRFFKEEKQTEFLHSKLSKKKRYSKRYNRIKELLNKKHKRISNKNKDFQHKVSRKIIDICSKNSINTIVCGDIKTKRLSNEKTKFKKGLNKSTQGRGTLSRFKRFLKYKSRSSGIVFTLINEAYTSQCNCLTGKREFSSDLSIRKAEIEKNIFIDRDLNSAVNILKRFKVEWSCQIQDLLNLEKMYINQNSDLCMINSL